MKKRKSKKTIGEIKDLLKETENVIRDVVPVTEFTTNDVRSHIAGGWFNHEAKLEVYVFHRCDFFEVRISRHDENGNATRLGCYILLAVNNGFDTHVCKFHDGEKEILIGYNQYRDEIVLSPSGITFERTTIKDWDWFAETMRHCPNNKVESFDQEDQIFKKGYVTVEEDGMFSGFNEVFSDLLGHNGSTPPATEI